jgi:L-ascorbate metabolism protein UlaG (beta-lactamase superfamily)
VLLVTHGHFDHFDADTLALARRLQPAMPCVHELSLYLLAQLGDAGAGVIGMNAGGTVETHGLRVTMVPAMHSSGDLMGGDRVHYFGEAIGFVIELENGFRIYDSGDTTAFGDMALIRDLYKPDLAIIPIGGHFTMGPATAAAAVGMLGVRDVLPVHWGTFPILAGTPAALTTELAARGIEANVVDWKPGESAD